MKKITILLTCLIVLSVLIIPLPDRPSYLVDAYNEYDLNLDNQKETFYFHTKEIEFGDWKTNIFVNNLSKPVLTVNGLLRNNRVYDISDSIRILELEISTGGKLINSYLYQYRDDKLIRIPVVTNSPSQTWDIWSSGGTEFVDTDSDGIKEMLVYHRHYPPEAKKTVEEYKFDEKIFQKVQEYEEITPSIYY